MLNFKKQIMKRRFNVTGVCVQNMHYMADTTPQMNEIFERLIKNMENIFQ